jgi:hypothetical protein
VLPSRAHADVILVGPWNEFSFTVAGVDARGCTPIDPLGGVCQAALNSQMQGAPPWTLTNAAPLTFRITDGFLSGDAFQVFDFGALILTTPFVASGTGCGNDPDACFINPAISHGALTLAAGSHSITIRPTASVQSGAAFFQVSTAPEPGTVALIAIPLLVMIPRVSSRLRRRRQLTGESTRTH